MTTSRTRTTTPLGETCAQCGRIHERCAGHAKHSNEERHAKALAKWGHEPFPCMKWHRKGQEVCTDHGGRTPKGLAAGARRIEHAQILGRMGELMAEAGAEVDDLDGPEALLAAIRRTRRMVWALDAMVGDLDSPTTTDHNGNAVPHPIIGQHHKYLALLGGMEEGALRLGLDVHRQQRREGELATIGTMVRELVAGLGRSLDDPEVVPVVDRVLALMADNDEAA
ncbi:MAG TPA: hypothetical protein VHK88_20100 [Aquihabitans sp.]|jgi:hypothetical protein|nr:hypothetical protein [Aquihabitans sp.]